MFQIRSIQVRWRTVRQCYRCNSTLSQLVVSKLFPQPSPPSRTHERTIPTFRITPKQVDLQSDPSKRYRPFLGEKTKLAKLYLDYFNLRNGCQLEFPPHELDHLGSSLVQGIALDSNRTASAVAIPNKSHEKICKFIDELLVSPSASYSKSNDAYEFHNLAYVNKLNLLHRSKKLDLPSSAKKTITELTAYLNTVGLAAFRFHLYLVNGQNVDTKRVCLHSMLDDHLFNSYFGLLMVLDPKSTVEWLYNLRSVDSRPLEFNPTPDTAHSEVGTNTLSTEIALDFVKLAILDRLVNSTGSHRNADLYNDQVISYIKSNNFVEEVKGWISSDVQKFYEFTGSFFNDTNGSARGQSQFLINRLKSEIYSANIPLALIPETSDDTTDIWDIIKIDNTILNSLLLVNAEVVSNSTEPAVWYNSPSLSNLLWNFKELGESRYKTWLGFYMEPYSERPYASQLQDFLKSVEFFKYIIERTGYFKTQPPEIQMLMLEKRTSPNLVSSQFYQMYALVNETDSLDKMIEELVDILDEVPDQKSLFKAIYKHLNEQDFSLTDIYRKQVSVEFPAIVSEEELLNEDNKEELGELVIKNYVIQANLGYGLKAFLDNNREVINILESSQNTANLRKWAGQSYLRGDNSELERMIVRIRPKQSIKENLIKLDEFSIVSDGHSSLPRKLQYLDPSKLTLPVGEGSLNKLMMIHYDHSRTVLETLGRNSKQNRNYLPDIITTVGTYGENYYKLLVLRKLTQHGIRPSVLLPLLCDKSFKLIVNQCSNSQLVSNQKQANNKLVKMNQELEQRAERNSYYRLRHHNQVFNQQLGGLAITAPKSVQEWVDKWLDPIVSHLGMISPEEQVLFLEKLSMEILQFDQN